MNDLELQPTEAEREQLFSLLRTALDSGATVHLSVHGLNTAQGLTLLQDGLIDKVVQGAGNGNNPPTGVIQHPKIGASVYLDPR